MKGIRMAVLGAALVLGVTTIASAQEARGGGQGRGGGRGGIARLMTDITVAPEVQTKIDAIVAKYQEQQRELMGAPAGTGGGAMQMSDEMRTKMTELTAKRNAEIRALLAADQQVVFDKNVEAAAQARRGGGGGGARGAGAPPPPPPTSPPPAR